MFKGLGDIAQLMKQAGDMKARMGEIKHRISAIRVQGQAGNGAVIVEATGDQQVLNCRIDPSRLVPGESHSVETLIVEAVNDALAKAREESTRQMSDIVGDVGGTGLKNAMANLGFGK